MEFIANISAVKVVGLILLAVGTVLCFAAKKFTAKFQYEHADMVCRFIGLGVAIIGFLIIFI